MALSNLIAQEMRRLTRAIELNRPYVTSYPSDGRSGQSYLEIQRRSLKSRVPLMNAVTRTRSTGRFL